MVVYDLDIVRIAIRPSEANPPLIVDPNAVLAGTIAFELLQPVPRWNAKVIEGFGSIDHSQLAEHGALHIGRIAADALAPEESLRVPVAKAPDHLRKL